MNTEVLFCTEFSKSTAVRGPISCDSSGCRGKDSNDNTHVGMECYYVGVECYSF